MKQHIKRIVKAIRNPFLPKQSREHLEGLRKREVELLRASLPPGGRLLEIGAGSGWQSRALASMGYEVSAIDIAASNYADQRIWPVADYDGQRIPFGDSQFDIVFSSNVLEHIPHVQAFQADILRVLIVGGVAVHAVPSSAWRFWTNVTHPLRYWTPPFRHGEHASNAVSEIYYFSRGWWTRLFADTGWEVVQARPGGIFYTGCSVFDHHLSLQSRERLAPILGSACSIFVLRKVLRET
jgi:2-polyprenyl-3-methyl-5-hydroxy-6-metoxy-1,4-benzoquinol methylase